MNNPVDKLFEKGLNEHVIEPGVNAWTRIAESLPKKNKGIIWFKAAAGLGILGLAVLLWFYSGSQEKLENRKALNNIEQPVSADELKAPDEVVNKTDEGLAVNNQKEKVLLADKSEKKRNIKVISKINQNRIEKIEDEHLTEVKLLSIAEVNEETDGRIDLSPLSITEQKANKPIVIVYELEEIKKQTDPIELDLSHEKKSGIKKVLEIANDMRTGESPISGLRQAKEEIFAFNFKKEDKKQ